MAKTTRGLREWPEDLELTDEMKAFAYLRSVDPFEEFAGWKDDCAAHGRKYIDWVAAWRTRVRNAVKFNKPTGITFGNDNDGGLARRPAGELINEMVRRGDGDGSSTGGNNGPNRNSGGNNRLGGQRQLDGKPSHLVDDSSSGVPDPELTLEQRRENIKKFKEMVASIGKKVS